MHRLSAPIAILAWIVTALGILPAPLYAAWASRAMVAADHRLASAVGVEILRQGGNAVDAAAATSLAVCVVNPSSCGIGGGGFMLIHLARSGRTLALDYRETAPAAARPDMFVQDGKVVPELSRKGGLAVGVPGEVAGLAAAVERFGRLPWRQIVEPARRLAADGFAIETHLAQEIDRQQAAMREQPDLARTFLHADGSPLRTGEILRRPQLAATLGVIAQRGARAFYSGPIAAELVAAVQRDGGVMTLDDLARYRPIWREPLVGSYKGHEILTMPPPSSGGGVLLQVLGILRDDVPQPGNPAGDAHLLAEAMKHGFADRARFYGDPDFHPVPLPRLLAPFNLRDLRARIAYDGTQPRDTYGSREGASAVAVDDHGTSHLSVLDTEGNAVACTTTINTSFGALRMGGETGILLNNEMDDFSAQPGVPNLFGLVGAEANAVAARKRPLSSMTPTIVTKDGEVVLVAGGSGGPFIISGTLQVLLHMIDGNLTANDAVAAPRIHDQWMPPYLGVEPGITSGLRDTLASYGHPVKEIPSMGSIQAIRVYRAPRLLEGAADPRKGGEAAGW